MASQATDDSIFIAETGPQIIAQSSIVPSTQIITQIVTPSAPPGGVITPSIIVVTVISTPGVTNSDSDSTAPLLLPSTSTQVPSNSIQSPASTSPASASAPGSGLTTGAKAGIGIGITLGVILLALGAFFLGVYFHKKKTGVVVDEEPGVYTTKAELDGRPISKAKERNAQGGGEEDIHELPASEIRAEMG